MKAIAGTKHLYIRKEWFYFRIKLPKRLGVREVRLSLNTQDLSYALLKLQCFTLQINLLKQLVVSLKSLDTSVVTSSLLMIKDTMLKQLAMSDIDGLVAELEQGYSHHAHAVKVLGQNSILDKNNKFTTALTFIAIGFFTFISD
ncbi:hypothetical protein A9267_17600 [Shewanella sp. UCD-FRSSP16_17]|nr:hypothetical protein A9267_17600 [Shewanella sp. UCD-FRSSP16_17]